LTPPLSSPTMMMGSRWLKHTCVSLARFTTCQDKYQYIDDPSVTKSKQSCHPTLSRGMQSPMNG
jgi:hypothetical protein